MTSVRARLGAAVAVALTATLMPAVASPASAATVAPSVVRTSTAPAASATVVLPASRTGLVRLPAAVRANPVLRGRVVVAVARRFAGVRYVAGGTSPSRGFDCSGYTRYVYSRLGIAIPRISRDQYRATTHITRAAAVPGDLVFFYSGAGRVYHAAIYAGGGRVWHSPFPGQRVKLERIWSSRVFFGRVRA
jgi:cell wall-associated NlpC family hydrolase